MTGKPLIRRERARRDIEGAADYYFAEGGEALELRFIDAIEQTLNLIADRPAIGSVRFATPTHCNAKIYDASGHSDSRI